MEWCNRLLLEKAESVGSEREGGGRRGSVTNRKWARVRERGGGAIMERDFYFSHCVVR